jgi:Chain length determinant protein
LDENQNAIRTVRLSDLGTRLLDGKWLIGGFAFAAFLLGCAYLLAAKPYFIATMTVAPPSASQMQSGTGGTILSEIGNTLGGGSGSSAPDAFRLYLDMLTSQATAARLESEHHVMQHVFAAKWNAKSQRWNPRSGAIADMSNALHVILGRPNTADAPSIQDLADFLAGNLRVDTPVLGSPTRVISFTYPDAHYAAQILFWLHQSADELVRESTRARTIGNINYLRMRLPEVANTDEHYALSNLLTEQERDLTLLSNNVDYSAMAVSLPLTPDKPFPPITKTLFLFMLAGFFAGCVIVIVAPNPAGGRWRSFWNIALNSLGMGKKRSSYGGYAAGPEPRTTGLE